ncbi:MAG: hypothetical protein JWO08_785 [Verrucomicrobiaceae bacterium]|nr:hypothetical protein [Verrucomicrobiaceae bacterium]
MHLFLRFSLCVWVSVNLVSCGSSSSGSSGGGLLGGALGMFGRTLNTVTRAAGLSASVENPDASSNAVAERGKIIEQRSDAVKPVVPQTSVVAQR